MIRTTLATDTCVDTVSPHAALGLSPRLDFIARRVLAPRRAWSCALTAIAASANDCDTVELKLARGDADTRRIWRRGCVARDAKPLTVTLPEGSLHEALYFDGGRWFYTWSESDVDHHLGSGACVTRTRAHGLSAPGTELASQKQSIGSAAVDQTDA